MSYHGTTVHLNGLDVPAKATNQLRQVTNLPVEVEDKLREAMCSLFGLDQIELLLVQHLINGGRLSTFGESLRRLTNRVMRYRGSERAQAHAMKDAIGRKFPALAPVINANAVKDEQFDTPAGDLFENAGIPLG